jgi:hypothetical protein
MSLGGTVTIVGPESGGAEAPVVEVVVAPRAAEVAGAVRHSAGHHALAGDMLLALAVEASPFPHAHPGHVPRLSTVEARPREAGRYAHRHREGRQGPTAALTLMLRSPASTVPTVSPTGTGPRRVWTLHHRGHPSNRWSARRHHRTTTLQHLRGGRSPRARRPIPDHISVGAAGGSL